MGIEVYDEITRNNMELHERIESLYGFVSMETVASEIAKTDKVMFIPAVLYTRMDITLEEVIQELHKKELLSATVKTQCIHEMVVLGVLVSRDIALLKEAVRLYYSVLNEAREAHFH